MYPSEKRSLYRFLTIYLLSTFILFSLGATLFYILERSNLLETQKESLKQEGEQIHHQLVQLQRNFSDTLPIYLHSPYHLLLLDKNKHVIVQNAPLPKEADLTHSYQVLDDHILYIKPVDPYYLGVADILLWVPMDKNAIFQLQKNILLFMVIAGLFFLALGYFLGKLFIAPMRESIERMNRFIQDTTHELNTPVSTILTNLELIEALHKCDAKEEMQRIEIASKTLSRIYDDLTYLKLNQNYHREIESVHLATLLQERLVYFSAAIEGKRISLSTNLDEDFTIDIDMEDAFRLIDNLISNAIKYNRMDGSILISLNNTALVIEDSGIGIAKEDLPTIHERFRRANQSEGGFGIGLNIVFQIAHIYGFEINIDSAPNQGTKVTILW